MVALAFFNTDPSPSSFVEPYQIAFSGSEDFLEHDCYLDCAQLIEETKEWIKSEIAKDPERGFLGNLSPERFEEILNKIRQAPTIQMKLKRKYGIC